MSAEDLVAYGVALCVVLMGVALGLGLGSQVAAIAGFDTSAMATRVVIGLCAIPIAFLYKGLVGHALCRPVVR